MDQLSELQQISNAMDAAGIDYALCGGLAMAVYAMPRATLDIDLMIELDSLFRARRVAATRGAWESRQHVQWEGGSLSVVTRRGWLP